ncbi:MAG: arginine decarboxylase, pyruvoyl-dependent [Euryarchaeota archaeon]|nr:arginine decarboxylase, pyruvoyl-dependent [Euryarchaeota archaeon]
MTGTFVPKKVFFTKGSGTNRDRLTSFEMALRDASIECYNLVTVSSILPPKCRIISTEEGVEQMYPGSIIFTVMSRISSNEPHRRISASIGMAMPENMETEWGYFAEHHSFGESGESVGKYSEKLAHDMYLGISDKIPKKTMNVTQSAVVGENGEWTTVLAAAVFLME